MCSEQTSHQRLIEQLGGYAEVARALSVPRTTAHSWYRRGTIPSGRLRHIVQLARARDIPVTIDLLVGLEQEGAAA